jgi:16S rRNA (cytosine967-C5)-methyltransferase
MRMEGGAYSSLALDGALSGAGFPEKDKAFMTRLFYGVIERMLTLDYVVSLHSKKPPRKLDREVLVILRMGIYQL